MAHLHKVDAESIDKLSALLQRSLMQSRPNGDPLEDATVINPLIAAVGKKGNGGSDGSGGQGAQAG